MRSLPSASKADTALTCIGSAVLPGVREDGEYSAAGNVLQAGLGRHVHGLEGVLVQPAGGAQAVVLLVAAHGRLQVVAAAEVAERAFSSNICPNSVSEMMTVAASK